MILCRVTGNLFATQKNKHLADNRLLVVQPLDLNYNFTGASMVALDRVDAGEGDLVLVVKEGGAARIVFENNQIPLQFFIVAVVDRLQVETQFLQEQWPATPDTRKETIGKEFTPLDLERD